eukprot:TRINITY_DN84951_c0_g1_i1.p2 TRINITY_DN84951_c0_g1~~TRINITY_DN84951_c0_g1_i1.p2  ORF type:complete len:125 (+),score=16.16 TRINITY_DN84951_c0_g1_i1:3-377(+)
MLPPDLSCTEAHASSFASLCSGFLSSSSLVPTIIVPASEDALQLLEHRATAGVTWSGCNPTLPESEENMMQRRSIFSPYAQAFVLFLALSLSVVTISLATFCEIPPSFEVDFSACIGKRNRLNT